MFISLSRSARQESCIVIENLFITDYLPRASGDAVKVYLFGLAVCGGAVDIPNNMADFAMACGMSPHSVWDACKYWQERNLMHIISNEPFEVEYLPIYATNRPIRVFKEEKYAEFNKQLEITLGNKHISIANYHEYYNFLEQYNFDPNILLMVARYCHNLQKPTNASYIITVAKDWESRGIKTTGDAENYLLELEALTTDIRNLYCTFPVRAYQSKLRDKYLYMMWQQEYGFSKDAIFKAATHVSNGMQGLDAYLLKCMEAGAFSSEQIEAREKEKQAAAPQKKIAATRVVAKDALVVGLGKLLDDGEDDE